jgi:dTDP-4-dehydrorhamnose reductase
MRVLVTGISGQVGGALVPRLRSHDVIALDRAALDLNEPEQIARTLDRLAPELIVNPAAYTAVDAAEDNRDQAMRINAEAPTAMARWAAARDVPLVHFSTDYVFDGSGDRPWRETDATNPLSVYGASKFAGEEGIRAAGGTFLIIRTSWVYSATGKNFLMTIARLARERKELRIVCDQIGAPTSAALIANAVTSFLEEGLQPFRNRCERAGGLAHLTAGGETSWHGFGAAIVDGIKARGAKLAVESVEAIRSKDYPTRAQRPLNSRLDLSRVSGLFAFTPPLWQDALKAELDLLMKLFP